MTLLESIILGSVCFITLEKRTYLPWSHIFSCVFFESISYPPIPAPHFFFSLTIMSLKFFWNLPLLVYDVLIQSDATSPNSKLPDVIYQVRLEVGYEISNEYTHTILKITKFFPIYLDRSWVSSFKCYIANCILPINTTNFKFSLEKPDINSQTKDFS